MFNIHDKTRRTNLFDRASSKNKREKLFSFGNAVKLLALPLESPYDFLGKSILSVVRRVENIELVLLKRKRKRKKRERE